MNDDYTLDRIEAEQRLVYHTSVDRFIDTLPMGDAREGFAETLRLRREFESNVARLLVASGPAEILHFGGYVQRNAVETARRWAVLRYEHLRWIEREFPVGWAAVNE